MDNAWWFIGGILVGSVTTQISFIVVSVWSAPWPDSKRLKTMQDRHNKRYAEAEQELTKAKRRLSR